MLEGLYEIYGVGALLIVGAGFVWRDKNKTITDLKLVNKKQAQTILDLVNKNTMAFSAMLEKLNK